jgi:hypothetical protein
MLATRRRRPPTSAWHRPFRTPAAPIPRCCSSAARTSRPASPINPRVDVRLFSRVFHLPFADRAAGCAGSWSCQRVLTAARIGVYVRCVCVTGCDWVCRWWNDSDVCCCLFFRRAFLAALVFPQPVCRNVCLAFVTPCAPYLAAGRASDLLLPPSSSIAVPRCHSAVSSLPSLFPLSMLRFSRVSVDQTPPNCSDASSFPPDGLTIPIPCDRLRSAVRALLSSECRRDARAER